MHEDKGEGKEIDGPRMMTMISLCEGNIVVIVLLDVQGQERERMRGTQGQW